MKLIKGKIGALIISAITISVALISENVGATPMGTCANSNYMERLATKILNSSELSADEAEFLRVVNIFCSGTMDLAIIEKIIPIEKFDSKSLIKFLHVMSTYGGANDIHSILNSRSIQMINDADIPGTKLNNLVYKQYRSFIPIDNKGSLVQINPLNSASGSSSDSNQRNTNSHTVRTAIDFSMPLQAQLIAKSEQAMGTEVITTAQVRVGFPMYMSSEIKGEDQATSASSVWSIAANRGYFYTTIAFEGGFTTAFKEYLKAWAPSIAAEVNLLLKCSTKVFGRCQVKNVNAQLQLDWAFEVFKNLRNAYLGLKRYGLQRLFRRAMYQVAPAVGANQNVAEGVANIVENAPDQVGLDANIAEHGEIPHIVADDVNHAVGIINNDMMPAFNEEVSNLALMAAEEGQIQAAEDMEDVQSEANESMDAISDISSEISRAASFDSLVVEREPLPIPLPTPYTVNWIYDKQLVEAQMGFGWLNQALYDNPSSYGTHYNATGSPDIFRFGVLMAAQAGAEIIFGDPTNFYGPSITARTRFFPNLRTTALVPLTAAGGRIFPFFD